MGQLALWPLTPARARASAAGCAQPVAIRDRICHWMDAYDSRDDAASQLPADSAVSPHYSRPRKRGRPAVVARAGIRRELAAVWGVSASCQLALAGGN